MSQKTKKYSMGYFKKGSLYSGSIDFQRFTTLDYNMDSYVGITGVGILSGWTVEQVDGLNIKILPGKGIIDGFAVESPYLYKKRSEMVITEREVEVVVTDIKNEPELDLTASEREQYVSVIQDYNPSYDTPSVGPIENSYVKVVVPYEIVLSDNSDNYIYAEMNSNQLPYPLLVDYPDITVNEPIAREYPTYQEYLDAKAAYDVQIQIIKSYEWRENPDNHFTSIKFTLSLSLNKNKNKILLAKVVTRFGEINDIDLSGVDNLENMQGQIKKFASIVIEKHKHGGNDRFDPSYIRLETDIRNAVIKSQNANNVNEYYALSSGYTTTSVAHRHSYFVNDNGDGYTVGVDGSDVAHFHDIVKYVVSKNASMKGVISTHTHSITNKDNYKWTTDSSFKVYVNGDEVGDETTIESIPSNYTFKLQNLTGTIYKRYTSSFVVNIQNPTTGRVKSYNYSYSFRTSSLLDFMHKMLIDFNNTYVNTNDSAIKGDILKNPLIFGKYIEDPSKFKSGIVNFNKQCIIGDYLLSDNDDIFTFVADVAEKVSVSVTEIDPKIKYDVKIEILGNTEVTGILNEKNILYLNASKIVLGEFDIERIPFIDHIGRMSEHCLPFKNSTVSSDGIRYDVIPSDTNYKLDHAHNIELNTKLTGVTKQVLVDNKPVYYGVGSDGKTTYVIDHDHIITTGGVGISSSEGLTAWQNNINTSNTTSSSHTHDITPINVGDPKTIYTIHENKNGHIFIGTSSGLYMIPNGETYLYTINGEQFYLIGDDLWDLLNVAKAQYEYKTGINLKIEDPNGDSIYTDQLELAVDALVENGDSYLMNGYGIYTANIGDIDKTDEIMIKKVTSFLVPDFKYTIEKYIHEIQESDVVVAVRFEFTSSGEAIDDLSLINSGNINDVSKIAIISKSLNETTSNSIFTRDDFSINQEGEPNGDPYGVPIEDIFVSGPTFFSRRRYLENDSLQPWEKIDVPFSSGAIRSVLKDENNNLWLPTSNGLFISRAYQNGNKFEEVILPSFTKDVKGVVDSKAGVILCVSGKNVYRTENGGQSWISTGAFVYDCMELKTDMSIVGASCVVVVLNDSSIYKSYDKGLTWNYITLKPHGDVSSIFVFNGDLFVSKVDGVYCYRNREWSIVLEDRAYSFNPSYDGNSFFVGCHNKLYNTNDGGQFDIIYSFDGFPLPLYIKDDAEQFYGYAYNSLSNSFNFYDFTYISNDTSVSALVDANRWIAENGGWNEDIDYEVFIDDKLAVSTVDNIDNRGLECENFTIDKTNGIIDFSAFSLLSLPVEIYDSAVLVDSTSGFAVGDRIVAGTLVDGDKLPTISTPTGVNYSTVFKTYQDNIEKYGKLQINLGEMTTYANIVAIQGNYIFVDSRFDKRIESPGYIRKISKIECTSEIIVNVYDSKLINKGFYNHDLIEDNLSINSDLRPYQLNNSYLSNMLQLTQAIRYVYPDIGISNKNNLYYDFHYDESTINNYIDVLESESSSQAWYNSNFENKAANSVNSLYIGIEQFSGNLFAATDIGIFWTVITNGFQGNWFYVNSLMMPVYDLIINNGVMNAATDDGIYYSDDMINWTKEASPIVQYKIKKLQLRWTESQSVVIPSHKSEFSNDDYSDPSIGYINTTEANYNGIKVGRSIRVINAGTLNGVYSVIAIQNQRITIAGGFIGITEAVEYLNVEIVQSSWWEQIEDDVNNTLIAGGENRISYKIGDGTWNQSSVPDDIDNLLVNCFYPLINGPILSGVTNVYENKTRSLILKSSDMGSSWDSLFEFNTTNGTILSAVKNENDNTEIYVDYLNFKDFLYVNGILDLKKIFVFNPNTQNILWEGYVVWNDYTKNGNRIIVKGNELSDIIINNRTLQFYIDPILINNIYQKQSLEILLGTNEGIYTDNLSTQVQSLADVEVMRCGITGTISSLGIEATIRYISESNSSRNAIISFTSEEPISKNQLAGQTLYIVNITPIESFSIVSNEVNSTECSIEIDYLYNPNLINYIGKSMLVATNNATLSVSFDYPVVIDQFNNGNLYTNNLENARTMKVVDSSLTSIIVEGRIPPNSDIAEVGERFTVVDGTGRLILYVVFNTFVLDNQFAGKYLLCNSKTKGEISTLIHSNTQYSITLYSQNDYSEFINLFNANDFNSFSIKGKAFSKLASFDAKITSIDSDHNHKLNLTNENVYGKITSVSVSTEGAILGITNVEGWNSIFDSDSSLVYGAKIRFHDPKTIGVFYDTQIISMTNSEIVVSYLNFEMWDELGYNKSKISQDWEFEADVTLYGYTYETHYSDFVFEIQSLLSDVVKNSTQISVSNSTNMIIGDKIEITDGFGYIDINYISDIIDINKVSVENKIQSSFFIAKNARIKVLRDVFTNNHIHRVKKNEIERVAVNEYLSRGYPSYHSHRTMPYIASVNGIKSFNNELIVTGSSSTIMASNNGIDWVIKKDLNESIDGGETIQAIYSTIASGNDILAGTTNGYVFSSLNSENIFELEKPLV